jgi:hypothetical protein
MSIESSQGGLKTALYLIKPTVPAADTMSPAVLAAAEPP